MLFQVEAMEDHFDCVQLANTLGDISASISSVREVLRSLQQSTGALDFKDGISLLSLKHQSLISYLNSLVILSSRRATGHSLNTRTRTELVFSAPERSCRGNGLGDLVDTMIEGRVVLEKMRVLETRMRYQIEKLIRVAEEPENTADLVEDPLAFRPNPHNLLDNDEENDNIANESAHNNFSHQEKRGIFDADVIYHPPRVAPVPYTEKSKSQRRKERPPVPSALASLSSDSSRPHIESNSGLGSTPSLTSGRAAYLKRLNEFEEENFSRVVMKKSDARRRARDEADLALGGSLAGGGGKHHQRAGGLEDEFGDVLRSVERVNFGGSAESGARKGDGYDELRQQSKKVDFLQRSRRDGSKRVHAGEEELVEHARKRSRFEVDTKNAKKKLNKGKKQ
ncbi:hypothetical protein C0995_002733 [Termitomyces sp. Mi166|nr:hypothetical protein C0995_002733 [Termitomyces sp. Mi166\